MEDMINHPPHYTQAGKECIEIIEELGLGYHLGSAFAYIWRHKSKGGDKDIQKARWYLDRYLNTEVKDNTAGMFGEPHDEPKAPNVVPAERPNGKENMGCKWYRSITPDPPINWTYE